jgi:hypothetical protein
MTLQRNSFIHDRSDGCCCGRDRNHGVSDIEELAGKERNVSAAPNYPASTDEPTRSRRGEELHVQIERGCELSLVEGRNQRRTERVIEHRSKKSSLHHADWIDKALVGVKRHLDGAGRSIHLDQLPPQRLGGSRHFTFAGEYIPERSFASHGTQCIGRLRHELISAHRHLPIPANSIQHLPITPFTSFNAGVSLQSLMALLGHVSAQMSLRYGRLFDTTVRAEYERALTLAKDHLGTLPAGPTATTGQPLPLADITGGTAWQDAPAIKSRLAGGFCLRAPAQGACTYANICEHCPNFRTDTSYLPVLAAQRADSETLAKDAEQRGWISEANRHHKLIERLDAAIAHAQTG